MPAPPSSLPWALAAAPGPWRTSLTIALGWQLLLIAAVDGRRQWLPDVLTLPLLVTGVMASVIQTRAFPWSSLIGAAAGFGALWLVALAYRRLRGRDGLGDGDPILFGAARLPGRPQRRTPTQFGSSDTSDLHYAGRLSLPLDYSNSIMRLILRAFFGYASSYPDQEADEILVF